MAKFRRGNLDLNTNQQIRLGNSLESIIQYDGTHLVIDAPNISLDDGGLVVEGSIGSGSGLFKPQDVWGNSVESMKEFYGLDAAQTYTLDTTVRYIGSGAEEERRVNATGLHDGNFVITYVDETDNYPRFTIYDSDGNIAVPEVLIKSEAILSTRATTLQDGNFVVALSDSGNDKGVFYIFDPAGNELVGETSFSDVDEPSNAQNFNLFPMSNGGFGVTWTENSSTEHYIAFYNSSGTATLSRTDPAPDFDLVGNTYNAMGLMNGNVMLLFGDDTTAAMFYKIFDYEGNTVLSSTYLVSDTTRSTPCGAALLNNGNVAFIWRGELNNATGVVISQEGRVVVSPKSLASSVNNTGFSLATLPNGGVFVVSEDSPLDMVYAVLDDELNTIVDWTQLLAGTDFPDPNTAVALKNGKVVVAFWALSDNSGFRFLQPDGAQITGALSVIGTASGQSTLTIGEDGASVNSHGKLILNGSNTVDGGLIQLHLGSGYDATIAYFGLTVDEDNLQIGPDTASNALRYVASQPAWEINSGELNVNTGTIDVGVNDVTRGIINVYGPSAGKDASTIRLYKGANYDTTVDYYQIYSYQQDLRIGPSNDPDAMYYNGTSNQWVFNPQGGNNIVRIGVDGDFSSGKLYLEGSNTDEGGEVWLFLPTGYDTLISSYGIQVTNDDLHIGPATDYDSLTYDGGTNQWFFRGTAPQVEFGIEGVGNSWGEIELQGDDSNNGGRITLYVPPAYDDTIEYYSVAVRDDNLQIGPLTDIDALQYTGSNNQWVASATGGFSITGNGTLYVGNEDLLQGIIHVYGNNSKAGGVINIYNSATYHGTIDYYTMRINSNSDDLVIGPSTDVDALKYDGGNNRWIFSPTGDTYFNTDVYIPGSQLYVGQDDNNGGTIHVYGGYLSESGAIRLYTPANDDSNTDYWRLGSTTGANYMLRNSSGTAVYSVDDSTLNITFANGDILASHGQINVGYEGSNSQGRIDIHGRTVDGGGLLYIHTADNSDDTITDYRIQASTVDLYIGPSTDQDALKYDGGNNRWDFTKKAIFTSSDVDAVVITGGGGAFAGLEVGVDNSKAGVISLFGKGLGEGDGGAINLYLADSYDGTIDRYIIQAEQDDLYIGPLTDVDALKYDGGTNTWNFTSGIVNIGEDDQNLRGQLNIYGGQSGNAELYIYFPADYDDTYNNFSFIASSSDTFEIGPNTDPDSLTYTSGGQWQFTGAAGVAITGGTFTAADGVFQVDLDVGVQGSLEGDIQVYGSGSSTGGRIRIYTADDYDDTIDNYEIRVVDDDMWIGPDTDPDALKYDGGTNQWQFSSSGGTEINSLTVNSKKVSGQAVTYLYGSAAVTDGDIALVDSTTVATVTLTEASDAVITVKRIGDADVTIQGSSGLVDGVASKTLTVRWQSMTFICDGTDWFMIGETSG